MTCASVTLMWSPVAGAARYDVFRDGIPVAAVTATTAILPVDAPAAYGFTVRARSAAGLTGAPAHLPVTTPPCS